MLAFEAASRPDDRFQSAGGGAPSGLWMEAQAAEHRKFESCGALLAGGARCEDIGDVTDGSRWEGMAEPSVEQRCALEGLAHDEIAIMALQEQSRGGSITKRVRLNVSRVA